MRNYLLAVLLSACVPAAARADDPPSARRHQPDGQAQIGQKAAQFTFKDIRYLSRALADFGDKKAFVLVFTTLDCPLVARYLPRVVELEREYRDKAVQFVAVNVGPNDPLIEVAYQAVQARAEFPFAKDFDGQVVRALGATRTPQAVLLDAARVLRYRGRIDDQFRLGGAKPAPGRHDLKQAIDDVLAGREVALPETPVDGCRITPADAEPPAEPVTFAEQIAPLLQEHCQECHRPGTAAPFSLLTYEDAAGHAEMIAEVVAERRMPPWYASSQHGQFINRRGLGPAERALVVDWVRGGRKPGDSAGLPEPRALPDGEWLIGAPDLVIKMSQPIALPASGIIPYKYIFLPYVFPHDTWVERVQILPGNRRALHHANMAYVRPGGAYGEAKFITGHVPGGDPLILSGGIGFKVPQGSILVLQVHYVTTGGAATDQTSVGFVFAKEKLDKQLRHFRLSDGSFAIPPGAPHHPVTAGAEFDCDATGVGLFTHMHVRGKDMIFEATYPDGRRETLLAVPNYNFNWQMAYRWAPGRQTFPRGTRIDCVAHYDNSSFNPFNPDPTATVREGPQTYEEMMYGFVFYTDDAEHLDLMIDPQTGAELPLAEEAK